MLKSCLVIPEKFHTKLLCIMRPVKLKSLIDQTLEQIGQSLDEYTPEMIPREV